MSFTLETPLANHILNGFFENASYVQGYEASDADKKVFELLPEGPNAQEFPHLARWYKHIAAVNGLTAKTAATASAPAAAEEDDDIDLFGSDDEEVDEEAEKLKQQRLAEYAAKKAHKPKTIAKTTITLDVKPWDDETPMEELTAAVKAIDLDGLLWGGSQLVAIGFGIKKLQINCVVEDDKVGVDDLTDKITELEDFVQSVDVAAMQKI
ncbi:Translation elongation factor 1 beta [Umbelopsis sp. WA50703]